MISVYKASAGSGKTFQLAYRYIKLLLGYKDDEGRYHLARKGNDNQRNIMALTFTNKATEEMKERIIHELALLAGFEYRWTKKSDYAPKLMEEFGCTADELKAAAQQSFYKLLFDYSYFQISTIDAFFQSILRTFAHDLDLSGDYEVDIDKGFVLAVAVRRLFDSLRSGSDYTAEERRELEDWIEQYLNQGLREGSSPNLFNRNSMPYKILVKLISGLTNEKFEQHRDAMIRFITAGKHKRFLENIARKSKDIVDTVRTDCDRVLELVEMGGYRESVSTNLIKLLEKREAVDYKKNKTLAKVRDKICEAYNSPRSKKVRNLRIDRDEVLDAAIEKACEDMTVLLPNLELLEKIRKNFFVVGLMARVQELVTESTADDNSMLLGDAAGMLKNIIKDDSVPFVFDRIGVILRHFLIDEFQDTSELQWENLKYLVGFGQAENHDSLIIGDEKQSIYRFRFSDASILQHKVQEEFGLQARIEGDTPAENTNWRSTPRVVEFNNELFHRIAEKYRLSDIYHNVRQQVAPKNMDKGGYVSVLYAESVESGEYEAVALERMFDNIKRQIASGYKGSDIVVLTRHRAEAERVVNYLMDNLHSTEGLKHLHVASEDAMFVRVSPAVRIILAMMSYYAMMDRRSAEGEMNSGRVVRRHRILSIINHYNYIYGGRGRSGEDAGKLLLQAIENTQDTDEDVDAEMMECISTYGVASLVERIIRIYLPEELVKEQILYITAFQDAVIDYFARFTGNLHTFLHWWYSVGYNTKVASAEDENTLQVMTMHKAKGLEYKCVHIPYGNWTLVDFKSPEWFDTAPLSELEIEGDTPPLIPLTPYADMGRTVLRKQYDKRYAEQVLDETNILYVAFTRAIDELIVTYPKSNKADSTSAVLTKILSAMEKDHHVEQVEALPGMILWQSGVTRRRLTDTANPPTALQPTEDRLMPPYTTLRHESLWKGVTVDEDEIVSEEVQRGTALHAVMERVRYPYQLSKAIRYQARRGRIPREEVAEVKALLERELSREEVQRWFATDVAVDIERTIFRSPEIAAEFSNDETSRTLRADRVVRYPDGSADVIDYKTGEERAEYHNQVREYMEHIRQSGCYPVRGYIWYLDLGHITEVNL